MKEWQNKFCAVLVLGLALVHLICASCRIAGEWRIQTYIEAFNLKPSRPAARGNKHHTEQQACCPGIHSHWGDWGQLTDRVLSFCSLNILVKPQTCKARFKTEMSQSPFTGIFYNHEVACSCFDLRGCLLLTSSSMAPLCLLFWSKSWVTLTV